MLQSSMDERGDEGDVGDNRGSIQYFREALQMTMFFGVIFIRNVVAPKAPIIVQKVEKRFNAYLEKRRKQRATYSARVAVGAQEDGNPPLAEGPAVARDNASSDDVESAKTEVLGVSGSRDGSENSGITVQQINLIADDLDMGEYEVFDDYAEGALLFTMVAIFSVVMPLISVVALINNVCELRYDTLKMMNTYARPTPRPRDGIGAWKTIFDVSASVQVIIVLFFIFITLNPYWVYYVQSWESSSITKANEWTFETPTDEYYKTNSCVIWQSMLWIWLFEKLVTAFRFALNAVPDDVLRILTLDDAHDDYPLETREHRVFAKALSLKLDEPLGDNDLEKLSEAAERKVKSVEGASEGEAAPGDTVDCPISERELQDLMHAASTSMRSFKDLWTKLGNRFPADVSEEKVLQAIALAERFGVNDNISVKEKEFLLSIAIEQEKKRRSEAEADRRLRDLNGNGK